MRRGSGGAHPYHMTDDKRKRRQPMFVPAGAPHVLDKREKDAKVAESILARADEILERFIGGESLKSIAATIEPPISLWKLRELLISSEQTADAYKNASIHRAHALVEDAVDLARTASAIGDAAGIRVATDTFLKVAGKLAPTEYGDKSKVELTGKDGGALELKADMTLSPADAYELLIRGNKS